MDQLGYPFQTWRERTSAPEWPGRPKRSRCGATRPATTRICWPPITDTLALPELTTLRLPGWYWATEFGGVNSAPAPPPPPPPPPLLRHPPPPATAPAPARAPAPPGHAFRTPPGRHRPRLLLPRTDGVPTPAPTPQPPTEYVSDGPFWWGLDSASGGSASRQAGWGGSRKRTQVAGTSYRPFRAQADCHGEMLTSSPISRHPSCCTSSPAS